MLPEQVGYAATPMTPVRAGLSTGRPIARTRHQRTESLRSLRSQTSEGSSGSSLPTPGYPPILQPGWVYPAPRPPSSGLSAAMVPTAFLDLDFNFIRANKPFKQILSNDQEIRGRQLQDVVVSADGEDFMTLRGRLKGEREAREPAYMPPMLTTGEDPIQGVMEDDVERLAAGFSDQTFTWTRAVHGPQRETFPARVRLAKTTAYFVVVTLPSFRPVEMLPPQPTTSLPSPGFMVPPPRTPILPSQPPDRRIGSQPVPPGPYYPYSRSVQGSQQSNAPSGSAYQPRAYPNIQPQSSGQLYAPSAQGSQASSQPPTPRLPAVQAPMQNAPVVERHQTPLAPAIQLPPLTRTLSGQMLAPATQPPDPATMHQPASDNEEESQRKRRRMDISDVLQR